MYDLEAECQKMYREDLRTVIARFRRTPAYLTILELKRERLYTRLGEVRVQVAGFYSRADGWLAELQDTLGLPLPNDTSRDKVFCHKRAMLRQARRRRGHGLRNRTSSRRAAGDERTPGVEKLDQYYALHSLLTLTERNRAKDFGFGLAITALDTVVGSFESHLPATGGDSTPHPFGKLGNKDCDNTRLYDGSTTTNAATVYSRQKKKNETNEYPHTTSGPVVRAQDGNTAITTAATTTAATNDITTTITFTNITTTDTNTVASTNKK